METSENNPKTSESGADGTFIDNSEAFLKACESNDTSELQKAITDGIPPETISIGMHTVVTHSLDTANSVACLEILLTHGGNIESLHEGTVFVCVANRPKQQKMAQGKHF